MLTASRSFRAALARALSHVPRTRPTCTLFRAHLCTSRPLLKPARAKDRAQTRGPSSSMATAPSPSTAASSSSAVQARDSQSDVTIRPDEFTEAFDRTHRIPHSRLGCMLRRVFYATYLLVNRFVRRPPGPYALLTRIEAERARLMLRHADIEDRMMRGWDTPPSFVPARTPTPVKAESRDALMKQLQSELPVLWESHLRQRRSDSERVYLSELGLASRGDTSGENADVVAAIRLQLTRVQHNSLLHNLLLTFPCHWAVSDAERAAVADELMRWCVEDARCILALENMLDDRERRKVSPGAIALAQNVLRQADQQHESATPDSQIAQDWHARSRPIHAAARIALARNDWKAYDVQQRALVRAALQHYHASRLPTPLLLAPLSGISFASSRLGHRAAASAYAALAVQLCLSGESLGPETYQHLRSTIVNIPTGGSAPPAVSIGPVSRAAVFSPSALAQALTLFQATPRQSLDPWTAAPLYVEHDVQLARAFFRLADALRDEGRAEAARAVRTFADQRKAQIVEYVKRHVE